MTSKEPESRVTLDPRYGYRRLDPLPEPDELTRFYESKYYDAIRRGGRAPDIQRLLEGGPDAERERHWLRATLHQDVLDWAELHGTKEPRRILEIGCGTGEFLDSASRLQWETEGVEPSEQAADLCRGRGHAVHTEPLTELTPDLEERFSLSVLLLVLEHVPDPLELLANVKQVLVPGGLIVVQVPNDFNALQAAAREALDLDAWWVSAPDHINYFDFGSLVRLLEDTGFHQLDRMGTFPMELFLLMGDDYVRDHEVGAFCHERRRKFELSIDDRTRRAWQRSLAGIGLGRTCLVVARKRG